MESSVLQRVRMLLAKKGIPQLTIAKATGIKQNTFSRQISGESALSEYVLSAIIGYFPDVSVEWLFTGKGEMLKSSSASSRSIHNEVKGSVGGSYVGGYNGDNINVSESTQKHGTKSNQEDIDLTNEVVRLNQEVSVLKAKIEEKDNFIKMLLERN